MRTGCRSCASSCLLSCTSCTVSSQNPATRPNTDSRPSSPSARCLILARASHPAAAAVHVARADAGVDVWHCARCAAAAAAATAPPDATGAACTRCGQSTAATDCACAAQRRWRAGDSRRNGRRSSGSGVLHTHHSYRLCVVLNSYAFDLCVALWSFVLRATTLSHCATSRHQPGRVVPSPVDVKPAGAACQPTLRDSLRMLATQLQAETPSGAWHQREY